MDSKLTLNVNKELANKAKLYARSRGRSLSDLVENYFKFLTGGTDHSQIDISSNVKSLLGSFKVPAEADYKKDLADQLSKKYQKHD
ncbi:MAG: hypothetical protein ISS19_12285 [Bacteroidales bacterium]|nr:hypothetical protein [Bacteroidales bacterium]